MALPRTITGKRAKLFADGKEIGFATGISGSESQMLIRVDVLNEIYSKEIVPSGRTVQVSAQLVRIKRGSAKALGLMASGKDTTAILNFPPITMVVYDAPGDEPIERIQGCVIEQRSWSVDQSGVFSENVSFQAIRALVEDEE